MSAVLSHLFRQFGCFVLVLVCSTSLVAAANNARPLAKADSAAEVSTMKEAYIILAVADHDYKGHRSAAMHALEAACKNLGTDIRGQGKGKEQQTLSDAQLRQALQLCQQAQQMATANKQPKVMSHLDKAITEINLALAVK